MTPEQYQAVQKAFLEIHAIAPEARESKLVELAMVSPETAEQVRSLLKSSQKDPEFLAEPLIQRSLVDVETADLIERLPEQADYPKQIGSYRILQQIGVGGHGLVLMAEQTEPIRRKVAIKLVKPGMDCKMILARFEAERQALAMMNHPSIANVIDGGTTDLGQPFFVMELVHGTPIDEFCLTNALRLSERLELFRQVCSAVHHAHQKGIIHRDIKPANVLVTVDSGKPLAKVIDFGIAKALHMPLTEKTMFTEYGQIIGTLEYMSPEQALMSQTGIDVRSDVYSLGVLLYLLITGDTPLSKKELLEKGIWELKNVLQDIHPQTPSLRITSQKNPQRWRDHDLSPTRWLSRVRGDLDWITMKALAKEPDQRYDSAADFSRDVECFLSGEAVVARPPNAWYTLKKSVRRHRVAVIIATALLFSMLITMLGLAWGYWQSRENLKVANDAKELVRLKAAELEDALQETRRLKIRADGNANRLAKMLKRQILESSWMNAIDGNLNLAETQLQDITKADRGAEWNLVSTVGQQMQLPILRSEKSGTIRATDANSKTHLLATVTTQSEFEVWNVTSRDQTSSVQLPQKIYTTIALAKDGKNALVGDSENNVTLVDIVNEKITVSRNLGSGSIRDASHDATNHRWLVTTGANKVFSLQESNLETIESVRMPERISRVDVSPDGSHVAVAGLTGNLFLLPLNEMADLKTVSGFKTQVAAFYWQKTNLLVCDYSGQMSEVDIKRAAFTRRKLQRLPPCPNGIVFDPNGNAFGSQRPGDVVMIQPNSSQQATTLRTFSNGVQLVSFFETSSCLAIMHSNGRINLIDQSEIELRRNQSLATERLTDGIIVPGLEISVTSHEDGSLKVWNNQDGSLITERQVHQAGIFEVACSESGDSVVSIGGDQTAVLCRLPDLNEVHQFDVAWGVRSPAFSPDGKWFAGAPDRGNPSALKEGTVDLWNTASGKPVLRLSGHKNWVTRIRFLRKSNRLVTLSVDGTAKLWSLENGTCLTTIDLSGLALATQIGIPHDEKTLAFGHDDGSISTWQLESGQLIRSELISGNAISGLCFDQRGGRIFVSVENQPELIVVDPDDLQIEAMFDAGVGKITAFRCDSLCRQLLLVGNSRLVRIWDLDNE